MFPLESPSLGERGNDVLLIAETFLKKFARKHGRKLESLDAEAIEHLQGHRWPGNVRELQNVIERAVIMTLSGTQVGVSALPLDIQNYYLQQIGEFDGDLGLNPSFVDHVEDKQQQVLHVQNTAQSDAATIIEDSEDLSLAAAERQLILKCLQRSEGNRTQAAEWMAVSIRTLRNKLARFKEEQREEFSAYY